MSELPFKVEHLSCYGCAHSASSEEPPGRPSGERPCCFCVRNPELRKTAAGRVEDAWWTKEKERLTQVRGHFPIDNYRSLDFLQQLHDDAELHRAVLTRCGVAIVDAVIEGFSETGIDPLRALDAQRRLGGGSKE